MLLQLVNVYACHINLTFQEHGIILDIRRIFQDGEQSKLGTA